MKLFSSQLCLVALGGLIIFSGCKKNQKPAARVTKRVVKVAKKGSTTQASKKENWAVTAYVVVRKALAADNLDAAKKGATALAALATTKAKDSKNKATCSAMAAAATKLAGAKDIAAARLAFGNLSKHTISLLKTSGMVAGLTAYQCPMAKGYKKWLQSDADMANPYMGKKMLKCGGKTPLTP